MSGRSLTTPKAASDRFYFLMHDIFSFAVALLWRQEVAGADNIPSTGPYVLAMNHLSAFDAPVAFINSPHRMRMFGADKWRDVPLIGGFLEKIGVIWVNRGTADLDAIKAALAV